MNTWDCLDCVEPIELVSASVEMRGEVTVAWEILLLDLELCGSTASIVHIVGPVGGWTYI